MGLDSDDINQEIALYLLENKPRPAILIARDLLRSKKNTYTWGDRIEHVSITNWDCIDFFDFTLLIEERDYNTKLFRAIMCLLSKKEKRIISLWNRGKTHSEIAQKLFMERSSISKSIKRTLEKIKDNKWQILQQM